jgi:hypothetical protein
MLHEQCESQLPYSSEGSFFDPSTGLVVFEHSVLSYGLLAGISLGVAMLFVLLTRKTKSR